jgi:hypothetical protein
MKMDEKIWVNEDVTCHRAHLDSCVFAQKHRNNIKKEGKWTQYSSIDEARKNYLSPGKNLSFCQVCLPDVR